MLKLLSKSRCAPLTQRQYSERMGVIVEDVVYALNKRSPMELPSQQEEYVGPETKG